MWTDQFQAFFNLMLMAAMLRLSYDLGKPRIVGSNPSAGKKLQKRPDALPVEEVGLSPHQAEWVEKAVKRYAEAQERKWQRWTETMFRPGT